MRGAFALLLRRSKVTAADRNYFIHIQSTFWFKLNLLKDRSYKLALNKLALAVTLHIAFDSLSTWTIYS